MTNAPTLILASIIGALFTGIFLPLKIINYIESPLFNFLIQFVVCAVSLIQIYLYFKNQNEVKDFKKFKDWLNPSLILDIVCPLALIYCTHSQGRYPGLIWFSVLPVRHFTHLKNYLDRFDTLDPLIYRLLPLLTMLPVLTHFAACGWIALGSGTAGMNPDFTTQYVKAVYFSFSTLTTVGYGDITATTSVQMLFTCVLQILGVGVFGYIVSNVSSVLSRSDAAREHHLNSLDKVDLFVKTHKISNELKSDIRSYYHYLWTHKKGYQDTALLEELPAKIQSDLFFHLNKNMIDKVPFLKGADRSLVDDLMLSLEQQIFVPGQKFFKLGDDGDALYFIQNGQVDILNKDMIKIVSLGAGSFFGEMALVSKLPRNANAVAAGYCDIFILKKEAFEDVTQRYPEFGSHIQDTVTQRKIA